MGVGRIEERQTVGVLPRFLLFSVFLFLYVSPLGGGRVGGQPGRVGGREEAVVKSCSSMRRSRGEMRGGCHGLGGRERSREP